MALLFCGHGVVVLMFYLQISLFLLQYSFIIKTSIQIQNNIVHFKCISCYLFNNIK